jgi:alkanesulfonate monooxygenase SsuD/methylene tetrahydromethanopterin reductase-like flavin-dependent oxidoreductase (luciferase family)
VESRLRAAIVGSEAAVKEGLERLVAATGADELIVVTDTWDHAARLESYRRLAEVAESIDMNAAAGLPDKIR